MGSVREAPRAVDKSVDVEVALEVAGFRWVTWNHQALAGAPLDTAGRFLAHRTDFLAHLQLPANLDETPSDDALARVPRYSESLEDALRAAEGAGVFGEGRATLERTESGAWVVHLPGLGVSATGEHLPELLCRAALQWVRGRSAQ